MEQNEQTLPPFDLTVEDSLDKFEGEAFYDLGYMAASNETKKELETYLTEIRLLTNQIHDSNKLNRINTELMENMDQANELMEQKMVQFRNVAIVGSLIGTAGLLAFLRERKVKHHLLTMVEETALATLDYDGSNVEDLCLAVIDRLSAMPVRSLRNPFGVSRKESEHLVLLLSGIVRNVAPESVTV